MSVPVASGSTGSRDLLRTVVTLLWSTVVWVALWGDLSAANVLAGLVLGLATLGIVPLTHKAHRIPVRPLGVLRFGLFFLWALVRASAIVAWEVVTPTNDINEGIVEVPMRTSSPGLITLLANAVSLTPGTLTLEASADPPVLYVHVLHLRGIEEVRADIHRLEAAALHAFGETPPRGGRKETTWDR